MREMLLTPPASHLSCPFCPAQSFPIGVQDGLVMYQCISKHIFLVHEVGKKDDHSNS